MAVILITGCSTGIGKATALVLAKAGHQVYATMRNPSKSPALGEIASSENLPITILQLDVDNEESVGNAVDNVLQKEQSIDILINNAGIAPLGSVEELPLTEFEQTMNTNYLGPIRCIQKVLPGMRQQRSGCIINITSVAGRIASASQSAYAASKFALEALSEALAQEVKPFNIRVAIVEPGIIETPIFEKVDLSAEKGNYPNAKRLMALFHTALQNPVPPDVIGEKILEIVDNDSWQLRYPAGPDSEPFLQWRMSMTDEQWIDWGAAVDDETWAKAVERDFGIDVRPFISAD
jgi:NAD(P)-dependent dehydrogenase (short-subunit alcohol dehydrogenase family)